MIGSLWTRVRMQQIIALYFGSENELKFYNLEARDRYKQDQTLLWTCVACARRCVNSRYAKFKYTGMKSDYIQITQYKLQ